MRAVKTPMNIPNTTDIAAKDTVTRFVNIS